MMRSLLDGLTQLIYPKTCIVCKNRLGSHASNDFICAACLKGIKRNLPPFCCCCGRQLDKKSFSKNTCPACQKHQLHFDRAWSPCSYTGVAKTLVHEFKYRNRQYLDTLLSTLMIDCIKDYDLPMHFVDSVVPIPLHPARLREREFNQAETLGNRIAKAFNKELVTGVLNRSRHTKTQTELKTRERFLNVRGSFSVTHNQLIQNKNLLLVDDVLTTGATCSEAARSLKEAGAGVVFVLTLAS